MRGKFSNIVLILTLGAFLAPQISQAQEGQENPEKTEALKTVLLDSTANSGELTIEENRDQSDALPLGPMPQLNLSKIPVSEQPSIQKEEKKILSREGDKAKVEESPSNLSFNFLYYLFYKFNLADSTDG